MLSGKITLHIIMKKSYKLKTKVFLIDPVLVSIRKGKMGILCFHFENEYCFMFNYIHVHIESSKNSKQRKCQIK